MPLLLTGVADAADPRLAFVRRSIARDFDPALPAEPLERWLERVVPADATIRWTLARCGHRTEVVEDAEDTDRRCVAAIITSTSRARTVELQFIAAAAVLVAVHGSSPDGYLRVPSARIGDVALAFETPIVPDVIRCASGTRAFKLEQDGATFEGCQRGETIDGFYRSWFRFGVALMERGTFANGARVGLWTRCDGEGRCESVVH